MMLKYLQTNATWSLKEITVSDMSVINVAESNKRENSKEIYKCKMYLTWMQVSLFKIRLNE